MTTEARDVLIVPPEGGLPLGAGGGLTCKVTSDDTGGAYAIMELILAPGQGSGLHRHFREDEVLYVLEGACEIRDGQNVTGVARGGTVVLPRGALHAFRNGGAEPCRLLITVIPGGLERFFEELDQLAASGQATPERIGELTRAYELEFLPVES